MGVRQRRKEGEKNGRGPDDHNATGGSARRGQEGGLRALPVGTPLEAFATRLNVVVILEYRQRE